MSFEPRAYQIQAVKALIEAYHAGKRQLLLRLPTGAGKTVVSALLIEKMLALIPGRRILFIAHRKEIIEQTAEKIAQQVGSKLVTIEQASLSACPNARVVVASIQTLTHRLDEYNAKNFGLLIIDECHHAFAKTWLDTIAYFGKNEDTLLLGLTATPKRSDGRCITGLFRDTAFEISLGELQEQGFLVPMDYYTIEASLGLGSLSLDASGDFQTTQLGKIMNTTELRALILRAWLEKAYGQKTIIFCASIAHAEDLTHDFLQFGVKAAFISGQSQNRDELIDDFRQGRITVLSNYNVLTEGFDDPMVTCVFLARPTRSPLVYTQCLGRGLRIYPGKRVCTVIDMVDRQQHQLQYNVFEAAGLPRSWRGSGKDPLREAEAIARIRLTDPAAFLKIKQALSLAETQQILMDLDPRVVLAGIDGMPLLRYQALAASDELSNAEILQRADRLLRDAGFSPEGLLAQDGVLHATVFEDEQHKLSPYLTWHIDRLTGFKLRLSFQVRMQTEAETEFAPTLVLLGDAPPVNLDQVAPVVPQLKPKKSSSLLGLKARLEELMLEPEVKLVEPPVPSPKEPSRKLSIQDKLKAIKLELDQR